MLSQKKPRKIRYLIIMLSLLAIIFGALIAWKAMMNYGMKQYFAKQANKAIVVSTVEAKNQTWQPYLRAIGTLSAENGVDISAEVGGIVAETALKSGEVVEKGTLLVKLNCDKEHADLTNYQAAYQLAQLDYQRSADLKKKGAISSSALDKAAAQLKQTQAMVAKTQAIIDQKTIRAPFTGKLGISNVNIGQYVAAGTSLVTLQNLDTLNVIFNLPETDLPKVHTGQKIIVKNDAYPKRNFVGVIDAVNSKVDIKTHNIQVRAKLPNEGHRLLPGMFTTVRVLLPARENVVTLPQTAVTFTLYGDSVYLVKATKEKDDNDKPVLRIERRPVVNGERRDNIVVVKSGLKAGDKVVLSGQLKLYNNARVKIDNSVKLD